MLKKVLDKSCQKSSKTEKVNILHIPNSVGTKFQVKLIILNFWTKLNQKGYFLSKNEKK